MANHISALKRTRQNKKRRTRNVSRRSRVHHAESKLLRAIEDKETQTVKELLPKTVSQIGKARSKGVLHKRTASRKIARLSRAAHRIGKTD